MLLILAATSNDASVRALGRRWKRIHRSVYLGTGLTFAHWILGTVSPMVAFICLALLLIAEVLRIADIRVLKQDG